MQNYYFFLIYTKKSAFFVQISLFFVKIANCVADVAGGAEERAGGVEAVAGDFGDSADVAHAASSFGCLPSVMIQLGF